MTATSSQSGQPGRGDAFRGIDRPASLKGEGTPQDALCAALSNAYAEEARRMKAFAGQRKFRAPVAEDFARGMLAPEPSRRMDQRLPRPPNGAWAVLLNGLTTWWRSL
ncbi:MAG: type III secretion protein [Pseudomonas sp.]|uniref:type III secretion protein n=1 Tax=Pseudomonas sp. TaxID=306 RepID=UPI003C775C48